MIELFLPSRLDTAYRGHKIALWLFGAVLVLKLAISVGSMFNGYETASSADGIPLVDLSGPFREQTQRGRTLFFPHDAHWTPVGHEVAAEVLSTSPIVPTPAAGGAAVQ